MNTIFYYLQFTAIKTIGDNYLETVYHCIICVFILKFRTHIWIESYIPESWVIFTVKWIFWNQTIEHILANCYFANHTNTPFPNISQNRFSEDIPSSHERSFLLENESIPSFSILEIRKNDIRLDPPSIVAVLPFAPVPTGKLPNFPYSTFIHI